MDYMKIGLAHQSDLADRQLTLLVDEKCNRGLPPNLADWNSHADGEKHLQHGLKGLHQAANAITSEIMAKAIPNGIFSRSSESHNQDKVSLGMSAASQCSDMIEQVYTVMALHLTCLAQALDLRGITLQGETSQRIYSAIRRHVPFVSQDTALDQKLLNLTAELKQQRRTFLEG
jgi:histidine ammonia-lyase